MTGITLVIGLGLWTAIAVGMVSPRVAGAPRQTPVKPYEGQVRSISIDNCGLQPGTCEGSIALAQKGGGEVALLIRPGTWIQRGDELVLIDELAVGNYLKARAAELPGAKGDLAITLEKTDED